MEFAFIVAIVLFFALSFVIFKLSKHVVKALTLVLSLLFVILIIGAGFIFYDFYDLKNNFASSQKTAVIKSNETAIAAIILEPGETIGETTGKTTFLSQEKLNEYSLFLKSKQYDKMLQDSYKLIIMDSALIDDLKEIKLKNNVLAASAIKTSIFSDDEELKKGIVEEVIKQSFESPAFIFEQYKKGNIFVYPETALFKAIRFFPSALFKSAAKKLFEGAKITGKIVAKKIKEQF